MLSFNQLHGNSDKKRGIRGWAEIFLAQTLLIIQFPFRNSYLESSNRVKDEQQ